MASANIAMQGITQRSFDIALRAAQDDAKKVNNAREQEKNASKRGKPQTHSLFPLGELFQQYSVRKPTTNNQQ